MYELSAIAIGFMGSFHCVAMCGPIVLAFSGSSSSTTSYLFSRGIYNLGRIVTYAILGLIAGFLGHMFLIAGFQKSVSIGVGIFILLSVLVVNYLPGVKATSKYTLRLNTFLRRLFSDVLKKRSKASLFVGGLANGILPCGFVYFAMAGAAITQMPLHGALYMIMFGLGTVPAMMLVAVFGKVASIKARNMFTKAAPILMILLALLLIYRGISVEEGVCPVHGKAMVESGK